MSTSSPPLVVHSHGQRYVPIWASSHEAKDFVTLMRARLRDLAQLQTMRRPTKRTSLALLTRARLFELGQGFELDVKRAMKHGDLVDAFAQAKRVSFERALAALSRDELKEICRADWAGTGISGGVPARQHAEDGLSCDFCTTVPFWVAVGSARLA